MILLLIYFCFVELLRCNVYSTSYDARIAVWPCQIDLKLQTALNISDFEARAKFYGSYYPNLTPQKCATVLEFIYVIIIIDFGEPMWFQLLPFLG